MHLVRLRNRTEENTDIDQSLLKMTLQRLAKPQCEGADIEDMRGFNLQLNRALMAEKGHSSRLTDTRFTPHTLRINGIEDLALKVGRAVRGEPQMPLKKPVSPGALATVIEI